MAEVIPIKPLDLSGTEDAELAGDDAADSNVADVGNAKKFAAQHRDRLKYCAALGGWFIWSGKYWAADPDDQVMRFAILTADALFADVEAATDLKRKDAVFKFYVASHRRDRLRAMIDIARHMLAVNADIFDGDPFLLNCANGTVDLRTGKLKAHDPADCITKLVGLDYEPKAKAERWRQFLSEVLIERGVASYMQRAVGYSLTGDQREECMFVAVGDGSNGKGVFYDLLRASIGPYGSTGRPELLVRKQRFDDTNNEDVASLRGRRLVEVSETGERHELNEDQVKTLTGEDNLSARMKYESLRTFRPTHHIHLRTNAKPIVRGMDYAIWRRLKIIPFNVRFVSASEYDVIVNKEPRLKIKDTGLRELLRDELQGILTWAIQGAVAWWNGGEPDLREPKIVTDAVEEYRSDQDRLGQFVKECCEFAGGEKTLVRDLYARYRPWAESKGWKPWAENSFSIYLGKAGFKKAMIGTQRAREGLRLKPWDPADDDAVKTTEQRLEKMKAKVRGAQGAPRS